ncbi:MAG TPA: DUF4307 domain-containing protein [Microbacteriaceae bacterium]|nr:DUF4307 domain-containing protein [Microbacteriaceae bacterium]
MPVQESEASEVQTRYGRVRKHRISEGWLIGGFAALAVIIFFVWAIAVNGIGSTSSTLGSNVTGTSITHHGMSVTVRYTVSVTPGTAYSCAVEADSEDHAIVGWKVVSFPATSAQQTAHEQTIRTVQPAVAGLISDCWVR